MPIPAPIRTLRRQTIKSIKHIVTPKLRNSGFTTGPTSGNPFDFASSKPLQLVAFKKKPGEKELRELKLPGTTSLRDHSGSNVHSILGFVEDGVIVDAYVGLVSQDYRTICVEDLCIIEAAIKKLKPEDWH